METGQEQETDLPEIDALDKRQEFDADSVDLSKSGTMACSGSSQATSAVVDFTSFINTLKAKLDSSNIPIKPDKTESEVLTLIPENKDSFSKVNIYKDKQGRVNFKFVKANSSLNIAFSKEAGLESFIGTFEEFAKALAENKTQVNEDGRSVITMTDMLTSLINTKSNTARSIDAIEFENCVVSGLHLHGVALDNLDGVNSSFLNSTLEARIVNLRDCEASVGTQTALLAGAKVTLYGSRGAGFDGTTSFLSKNRITEEGLQIDSIDSFTLVDKPKIASDVSGVVFENGKGFDAEQLHVKKGKRGILKRILEGPEDQNQTKGIKFLKSQIAGGVSVEGASEIGSTAYSVFLRSITPDLKGQFHNLATSPFSNVTLLDNKIWSDIQLIRRGEVVKLKKTNEGLKLEESGKFKYVGLENIEQVLPRKHEDFIGDLVTSLNSCSSFGKYEFKRAFYKTQEGVQKAKIQVREKGLGKDWSDFQGFESEEAKAIIRKACMEIALGYLKDSAGFKELKIYKVEFQGKRMFIRVNGKNQLQRFTSATPEDTPNEETSTSAWPENSNQLMSETQWNRFFEQFPAGVVRSLNLKNEQVYTI